MLVFTSYIHTAIQLYIAKLQSKEETEKKCGIRGASKVGFAMEKLAVRIDLYQNLGVIQTFKQNFRL